LPNTPVLPAKDDFILPFRPEPPFERIASFESEPESAFDAFAHADTLKCDSAQLVVDVFSNSKAENNYGYSDIQAFHCE